MRDDTLLKAEGRVKLQLKGNVMHQEQESINFHLEMFLRINYKLLSMLQCRQNRRLAFPEARRGQSPHATCTPGRWRTRMLPLPDPVAVSLSVEGYRRQARGNVL
ncbi:hypothetical protein O5623_01770 [Escherichia coli]|nr:hypothetical protein [Escherichia coli]